MRKLSFEQAKAQYPLRFTMEHVPQWALKRRVDGSYHAPQYSTDKDWYDRTFFRGEHELATRRNCHSTSPTWPLGRSLAAPYRIGAPA